MFNAIPQSVSCVYFKIGDAGVKHLAYSGGKNLEESLGLEGEES